MPYELERSHRLGHVPTVLSDVVQQQLERFYIPTDAAPDPSWLAGHLIHRDEIPHRGDPPQVRFAVAVDGSHLEVAAREQYPSIRVGYLQVGVVIVDLAEYRTQDASLFVDPVALAHAVERTMFNAVVPTSNAYVRPAVDIRASIRQAVNDVMVTRRIDIESASTSSLTFEELLLSIIGGPGRPAASVTLARCPTREDTGCGERDLVVSPGGSRCPRCDQPVFVSDVLRLGEEVEEHSTNLTVLGRLMSVLEVLTLLGQLETLWRNAANRRAIDRFAFIYDGPLAMFGTTAPLKTRIVRYLHEVARELDGNLPLIVGIEKTGRFVDHAAAVSHLIDPGHLVVVDQTYLQRILNRSTAQVWGKDEYWGRKFLYKTADGRLIVLTVPPFDGSGPYRGGESAVDLGRYPTLHRTMALLDAIGTTLYKDAVIPIALAHDYVAYPIGVGSDVLVALAQEALGVPARPGPRTRPTFPR